MKEKLKTVFYSITWEGNAVKSVSPEFKGEGREWSAEGVAFLQKLFDDVIAKRSTEKSRRVGLMEATAKAKKMEESKA